MILVETFKILKGCTYKFADVVWLFATSPVRGLILPALVSLQANRLTAGQAATTPRGIHCLREILFKNIDCSVYIGMDYGMALFANIETTTDSACIMLVMTDTASLARVFLAYCNNADAFKPCLIGEHLKNAVKRPFMKMLVTTASLVFVASDVLKVTHDDRGSGTVISHRNIANGSHCL